MPKLHFIRATSIAFYHSGIIDETTDGSRVFGRSPAEHGWSGRRAAAAHRWSLRSGSIDWRSSIAMHSPSTASGVATALRASKSRQNHSSVCSGSPLRSRPVKGQPPAPNARLGAAPPCELQPRRWPTQLTLREACPGSGIKGGVFFRPSTAPKATLRLSRS